MTTPNPATFPSPLNSVTALLVIAGLCFGAQIPLALDVQAGFEALFDGDANSDHFNHLGFRMVGLLAVSSLLGVVAGVLRLNILSLAKQSGPLMLSMPLILWVGSVAVGWVTPAHWTDQYLEGLQANWQWAAVIMGPGVAIWAVGVFLALRSRLAKKTPANTA